MPNDHSFLSPSGAHRWITCPPSAQLEAKYPNQDTAYTTEGTLAHSLAEVAARGATDGMVGAYLQSRAEIKKDPQFTQEMEDCALAYAEAVTKELAKRRRSCKDAYVDLEQRLDLSTIADGMFGTGDCIIVAEPTLTVIDFKYGKGVPVDVKDNPQLMLYGLGALELYDGLYDITRVKMCVFQPRLSRELQEVTMTAKALREWAETTVRPAAKLAMAGEGQYCPTEEACRFCRARGECRARANKFLELFDENPEPGLLTKDEQGAILGKAKEMKKWLADLEASVTSTLLNGQPVFGWKMVEGRSTRRLGDPDKVVAAFEAAGIDKALLYKHELITLTQMEKDFGKKTVGEILTGLIEKPKGAPTLAPESDKRPAYVFEDDLMKAFDEQEENQNGNS